MTQAPLAPAGDPEIARIVTLVRSITLAVDLEAYDLARRAFAEKVVVDYISLWGGAPMQTTPDGLMAAWQALVPGFDTTWHELTDLAAEITGEEASARARVDARHWIDDQLWRPVGSYLWRLRKIAGAWKVTHMVFTLAAETGDRALAERAAKRAAERAAQRAAPTRA
ncbi:MAG: nuclear transport factor 2 family protein [Pseudomonadota bacterium]